VRRAGPALPGAAGPPNRSIRVSRLTPRYDGTIRASRVAGAVATIVLLLAATACTPLRPAGAAPVLTWRPALGQRWQIQLAGRVAPAGNATFYDLDPYTTSADEVRALTVAHRRTICHLDVGTSDAGTPDAFPHAVLGRAAGPGRRWLDIRDWSRLKPTLTDRFSLCRAKGFQAVDADLAFGYAYRTGFPLDRADQLAFDVRVIALAHHVGLGVAVRTSAALQPDIVDLADFAVVAGCVSGNSCAVYRAYVSAGKAVLDMETGTPATYCPLTLYYRFAVAGKPDGPAAPAVTYC